MSLLRDLASGVPLLEAVGRKEGAGRDVGHVKAVAKATSARIFGAGEVLQPWLEQDSVTDVLVTGGQVWVDRGAGLERTGQRMSVEEVGALARRLAAQCGKRLDQAAPIVDATLPGGTRLHAVLPPLSTDGPLLSLRVHRQRRMELGDLVSAGALTPGVAGVLAALVERRATTFICGATGCGKTTLLGALLTLVPPNQRIVCLEETSELRPNHPHVVHLQEREANVEGSGRVTLSDLTRAAMRMRPDRLVLGECRGPEVRDVLTALNTGHSGGFATLHANRAADVPARLIALGALAALSPQAVEVQFAAAVQAVVALRRLECGRRIVSEVAVVQRAAAGVECAPALAVRAGDEEAGLLVSAGPGLDGLVELVGRQVVLAALGRAADGAALARSAK
ncbi:TadA family conjugal transfer-associated ATPase [Buchananella felis]|uniref:TadA family conjugal transfer-associated ATPase n=1 Tax=Buchananella felis TaxID=3231492 RepID=UPI003526D0E2